jgi:hypothetical protein
MRAPFLTHLPSASQLQLRHVASTEVRSNPVGRFVGQNMHVSVGYARRVGTFWVIKVFAGQRFPRSSLASPSHFQNSSRNLREKKLFFRLRFEKTFP